MYSCDAEEGRPVCGNWQFPVIKMFLNQSNTLTCHEIKAIDSTRFNGGRTRCGAIGMQKHARKAVISMALDSAKWVAVAIKTKDEKGRRCNWVIRSRSCGTDISFTTSKLGIPRGQLQLLSVPCCNDPTQLDTSRTF